MTRMFVPVAFGFVLAIGVAEAVPAKPLFEPEPPPPLPVRASVSLNGTTWLGKYLTVDRTFVFEADGTLSYKSATVKVKGAAIKNRGSWKLDGNVLHFEHYIKPGAVIMEFRGVIQNANTIVGESVYKTGAKSPQTLQRILEFKDLP